jgi:hypothetical protein
MSYSLTEVSSKTISGISDAWFQQLEILGDEGIAFSSSVERIVDWCEKEIEEKQPGELCLWALCSDGGDNPRAIVEMTDARKSKDPSFKFLNIYLEPRLILDYKDEVRKDDLSEAIKIISFALTESMKISMSNGLNKLKVYGRTAEMRSMFDNLILSADDNGPINLYRQSKWLVIEAVG